MQSLAFRLSAAFATFLIGVTTAGVTSTLPAPRSERLRGGTAAPEVLSVEREYIRAHTERDTDALDRILADDFVIGPSTGRVMTKEERLSLVANPDVTFVSVNTKDVQVEVDGEDALVTGRAAVRGRYKGREFVTPSYGFTRLYEKRRGRWQISSVQISTPSPR